jgi:hypothetical protein
MAPAKGLRRVSGHTPAQKTTAKAQRKNDNRVIARAMSNLGSARARRATARSEIPSVPAQVIPEPAVPARPGDSAAQRAFIARDHHRRDIGSHLQVLDLAAPDAPAGAPEPFRDPEGVMMRFVAYCVTHDERKHYGGFATACRAAKASHQWCPNCKTELARHHRLHSKANAQPSPKR